LITGHKKALTEQQARKITVARYEDLSAASALKMCTDDESCMKFIPDHWVKPKAKINRDFLWVVLATI
jgi:hypothetical protein